MDLSPERQTEYQKRFQKALKLHPSAGYYRARLLLEKTAWFATRKLHIEFSLTLWPFGPNPEKIDRSSKKYASEALICAAALGNISTANALLKEMGADVDYQDDKGMTPLTMAIARKRLGMAEFLLKNKANPKLANKWGWTPTLVAVDKRVPLAIPLLNKYGADFNQYTVSTRYSKFIFPIFRERIYPLGLACMQEAVGIPSRPVIRALLSAGATPDITIENMPATRWINKLSRKNSRFWLRGTFKTAQKERE